MVIDGLATLAPADVAEVLRVSRSTVARLVARGDLPPPRQVAGRPRWLRVDLKAWLEAQPIVDRGGVRR